MSKFGPSGGKAESLLKMHKWGSSLKRMFLFQLPVLVGQKKEIQGELQSGEEICPGNQGVELLPQRSEASWLPGGRSLTSLGTLVSSPLFT